MISVHMFWTLDHWWQSVSRALKTPSLPPAIILRRLEFILVNEWCLLANSMTSLAAFTMCRCETVSWSSHWLKFHLPSNRCRFFTSLQKIASHCYFFIYLFCKFHGAWLAKIKKKCTAIFTLLKSCPKLFTCRKPKLLDLEQAVYGIQTGRE